VSPSKEVSVAVAGEPPSWHASSVDESSPDASSWLTIESFSCRASASAVGVGMGDVEQPLRCAGETLREDSSPPVLLYS
jgi:hypothetical protein